MDPNLTSEIMRLCKCFRHVSIVPSITHTQLFMRFVLTIFLVFYVVGFFFGLYTMSCTQCCLYLCIVHSSMTPHRFCLTFIKCNIYYFNLRCFTMTSVDALSIPNSFCAVHQSSPDLSILSISITVPYSNVMCVFNAFDLWDNCK